MNGVKNDFKNFQITALAADEYIVQLHWAVFFFNRTCACPPNYFWFSNKETQAVRMSLLSHRATCNINSIKINETKRFHGTNYNEPRVYVSNKSMTIQ